MDVDVESVVVLPALALEVWYADCARKAAKKCGKNGRLVGSWDGMVTLVVSTDDPRVLVREIKDEEA